MKQKKQSITNVKFNLLKSKRGVVDALWEIVLLFFLVGIFLIFFFVVQWFANISLDTSHAEAVALVNRFFYSPNSISYSDNQRSYPGIIDLANFNDQRLNNTVQLEKNHYIAARLTLYDINQKKVGKQVYFNKNWFERWEVLASFKGKGAVSRYTEKRYVLFEDTRTEDTQTPRQGGFLIMEVLVPNS